MNKIIKLVMTLFTLALCLSMVSANTLNLDESTNLSVPITNNTSVTQIYDLALENNEDFDALLSESTIVLGPNETTDLLIQITPTENTNAEEYELNLVATPRNEATQFNSDEKTHEIVIELSSLTHTIKQETVEFLVRGDLYTLEDSNLEFHENGNDTWLRFISPTTYRAGDSIPVTLRYTDTDDNEYEYSTRIEIFSRSEQLNNLFDPYDTDEKLFFKLGNLNKDIIEESVDIQVNNDLFDLRDNAVSMFFEDNDVIFQLEDEFETGQATEIELAFRDEEGNRYQFNYKYRIGNRTFDEFYFTVKADEEELRDQMDEDSVRVVVESDMYYNQDPHVEVEEDDREVKFTMPNNRPVNNGQRVSFSVEAEDKEDNNFVVRGYVILGIQEREELPDEVLESILDRRDFRHDGELLIELDDFNKRVKEQSIVVDVDRNRYDSEDSELNVRVNSENNMILVLEEEYNEGERFDVILTFEDEFNNDYEISYQFNERTRNVSDLQFRIRADELNNRIDSDTIRVILDNETYVVEDAEVSYNTTHNEISFESYDYQRFGERTYFIIEAEDDQGYDIHIRGNLILDFDRLTEDSSLNAVIDEVVARNSISFKELQQELETFEVRIDMEELKDDIDEDETEFEFNRVKYTQNDDYFLTINGKRVRFESDSVYRLGKEISFELSGRDDDYDRFLTSGRIKISLDYTDAQPVFEPSETITKNVKVTFAESEVEQEEIVSFMDMVQQSQLKIVSAPQIIELQPGEEKEIEIVVYNESNETVMNSEVRLRGLNAYTVFEPVSLGMIAPNSTKKAIGTIKALKNSYITKYPILAEVVSDKYVSVLELEFVTIPEKTEEEPLFERMVTTGFVSMVDEVDAEVISVLLVVIIVLALSAYILKRHDLSQNVKKPAKDWISYKPWKN